jgi:hypothetical protein
MSQLRWRPGRTRGAGSRLCGIVLALGLLPAAASAGDPAVGVSYRSPRDCPDAVEFIALLTTRTGGSWRFQQGAGDPQLVVEIRDAEAGKLGRLRRRIGGQVSEAREIRAADCRDVVQALALSAALSLGPAGIGSAGEARPWIWTAGVGAAALALLPPGPMLRASAHVETSAAGRGDGFHAPDLRLTLAHARNDLLTAGTAARFSLSALALRVCPLGWRALRVCLEGEAGLLAASGRAVDRPRSVLTGWTAAGVVASARWEVGRWLIAESFAGLQVPLRRADFVFEMPRRPVATIPAAVVLGGVSFARTIP